MPGRNNANTVEDNLISCLFKAGLLQHFQENQQRIRGKIQYPGVVLVVISRRTIDYDYDYEECDSGVVFSLAAQETF
jgi:hypothetical protein